MADEVDAIVERLLPQLLPEFRKAARTIVAATLQWERDRVVELIRPTPTLRPMPIQNVSAVGKPIVRQTSAGYRAVSTPVKNALDMLGHRYPEGVGIAAVMEYLRTHQFDLSEDQTRAALKQLARTGAAYRVARGLYLPATNPNAGGEPGAGAPGPIQPEESVEAADTGPKWGGT